MLVAGALDRLDVQGAVVVGHSMGFDVATPWPRGPPARRPAGQHRRGARARTTARLRSWPSRVRAGGGRGDCWQAHARLRGRGRLRRRLRPGLRRCRRLPEPRPGGRGLPRDDLHLLRGRRGSRAATTRTRRRSTTRLRQIPVPLSRSSAPRTRSATPRPRRPPTPRCRARGPS